MNQMIQYDLDVCGTYDINEMLRILNASVDKDKVEVVLIAYVRDPRGYDDNTQLHGSETEKFSVSEFYEIYKEIVNAGYFIKATYFNVLDYIESPNENIVVINLLKYNLRKRSLRKLKNIE